MLKANAQYARESDPQIAYVNDIIGSSPIKPYGRGILLLCVLIGMTEGYDVAAMSFAAPMVAKIWALGPDRIGALLSTSVVGLVLGSFLFSPIGDSRGRRTAVVLGLLIAGVGTGAGAYATTYPVLLVARLIAGVGLGIALPNTATLSMELVPRRLRNVAVVAVSSGLALGGAVGAMIVGAFVRTHGYAFVFLLGGVATIAACLLAALLLPEAPVILLQKGQVQRVERLVRKLTGVDLSGRPVAYRTEQEPKSRVAALFEPERRVITILLWLTNFASVGLVYFLINWTPSLLVSLGASPEVGIRASALFSIGGVVGAFIQVWLMRRIAPATVLLGAFVLCAAATVMLTFLPEVDGRLFAVLVIVAATCVGAQFCLNAVVAQFYPAVIRATGLAYATGAGRVGAMLAPAVAGAAIVRLDAPSSAFALGLIPVTTAVAALALLRANPRFSGRQPVD